MASAQQSPFDYRLILPLPISSKAASSGPGAMNVRAEGMKPRQNEGPSPLREVLHWKLVEQGDPGAALDAVWARASERIAALAEELRKRIATGIVLRGDARVFSDNLSLMRAALIESKAGIEAAHALPSIEGTDAESPVVPRAFALVAGYLGSNWHVFNEHDFAAFLAVVQERVALQMAEVWSLKAFLELVLLNQIAGAASERVTALALETEDDQNSSLATPESRLSSLIHNLQQVSDLDWRSFFEQTAGPERILRSDPQGAYQRMDFGSREAYRAVVADLAAYSRWTEQDIARKAIALAKESEHTYHSDQRARERRRHVGYYLVDAGRVVLKNVIGYRPPVLRRISDAVLKWPDFFYLIGIELTTLVLLALLIALSPVKTPPLLALVLFLLPAVDCAVAIMNLLATRMFPPQKLARLDFSKGIPGDCVTLVAVPTLLTSEEQVRAAVEGLEIRFLANRDSNLHFALLTDPPDSTQQFDSKDQFASLCASLIEQLNERYGREGKGSFFHFHRNRTYNASEGLWMGWERKRGKLLDLNRLLLRQSDAFSIKIGNLSLLTSVRYVITLDLDTQLPADAAYKLVGTLAHPLNRAVIDPRSSTVVEGYGILQPRVDISVRSAGRSRFVSLLSDTGVDLYSRAVSDVYQDLFGEGIFTGKGIYEVETFQKVLQHRFPCNRVLSHDLIEGLYARAGLVSDVEVVDDYPSHFSAFSRRKHRWVRGDWQIIFGLLPRVRDHFGNTVRNPLSHISRWKIIDNLRRSLTECATFVLFLCAWLWLPGNAVYWSLAALALIFLPTYFQIALAIATAKGVLLKVHFWKNWFSDFANAHLRVLLRLTLLCHQSLVAVDAVVRTLIRMKLTHKKLLQWETAADAEARADKNVVDAYLKWSPALSLPSAAIIFAVRPSALEVALPFLVVWASSNWICKWLNRPPRSGEARMDIKDRALLRNVALRTWRFFREFSTRKENWLIPDIVQAEPPAVAHRISTTNLGLLLDARLAAHDLGFLTLAEFILETGRTLETVRRMRTFRGHLYNWYTTDTLEPVDPGFVSAVDNGNLLCSLWTLKQGCLEAVQRPVLGPALWQGIHDVVGLLVELAVASADRELMSAVRDLSQRVHELPGPGLDRFDVAPALEIDVTNFLEKLGAGDGNDEIAWWSRELSARVTALGEMVRDVAPWLVGEFATLRARPELSDPRLIRGLTLESASRVYDEVCARVRATARSEDAEKAERLCQMLERSAGTARTMASQLSALAASIDAMADAMDFAFLYDSRKKQLSIGYDGAGGVSKYHYDLVASEARAAVFAAVATGQIPQESWFELGRSYVTYQGEDVLRSWTGTAFEYLMPCLWMRAYRNTLLDRCSRASIRVQRKFVKGKGMPWGISESSCNERNPDGHYRYHAFGVPGLAINRDDCSGDVVIAPYATFLALPFDRARAVVNLRKMKELGWLSAYGFYEAADFTPRRVGRGNTHEVVRNWMAHHQGMSLMAIANVLCDSSMPRRFHAEPCVAAHERLLQESYPRVLPREKVQSRVPESAPKRLIDLVGRTAVASPVIGDLAPKLQ